MNAKDKEFYDIVFKNCTEEEIYAILLKKKEIDDKTPKLRTEDENKMLRFLFNKMRKQAGPGLYGPAPSLAYGMRL